MKATVVSKRKGDLQWDEVQPLYLSDYPWYEGGLKQATEVRLVYDHEALYIHVEADDVHSSAKVIEDNGGVYLDSCFEFFFTPEAAQKKTYINLEINCIGSVYLAVRSSKGKHLASSDEIARISVETSLEKRRVKEVALDDWQWILDIKVPFDLVESLYQGDVDYQRWCCNFYRCGGLVDDQYAVWNHVVASKPDFHQPLQFASLIFA